MQTGEAAGPDTGSKARDGASPGSPASTGGSIPRSRPNLSIAERFWSHVDMSAGDGDVCWPWTGALNKYGYGHFRIDNNGGGVVRSHRLALTLVVGPAPDDAPYGLHGCDNPACCHVHPKHVYWGTQSQNVKDEYRRYRREPKRIELHGEQQDLT